MLTPPASERAEIVAILGREPRGACRVAKRDAAGTALVIAAEPIRRSDRDGRLVPDPDFYWLCCPRLRVELARLEATGTITKIETILGEMPGGLARLRADHRRYVAARYAAAEPITERAATERAMPGSEAESGAIMRGLAERGIAGTSRWDRVKCLHAHQAFALMHGHEAIGPDPGPDHEPLSTAARHGVVAEILAERFGITRPTPAT